MIDTILRGWKLPKFYFLKTSDNPAEFEVLDGQQRLSAIWEFMDGQLTLSTETANLVGGASKYHDLPDTFADAFDDYEIEYDEISDASDEESREFFQRLQVGLPLTSSERLNAVVSKLRNFCRKQAEHSFFTETTTVSSKRYGHFDILTKIAAIEIEGLDSGVRCDDIKKIFEENSNFSSNSAAAKRIKAALDMSRKIFGKDYSPLRNRTLVQSTLKLICHLNNAGLKDGSEKELRAFFDDFFSHLGAQVELGQDATDVAMLKFQRTVNANVRGGARTRQTILLSRLFRKYPQLFSVLSNSTELSQDMDSEIVNLAKEISNSIATTNELYSGSEGKDLFKATNKTASALSRIGKPISSLDEYKSLIDDLYFVFRESVGQRLEDDVPVPFMDVTALRTQIRHDTDHGKANKVAKKKKDLAATFRKYAGGGSPESSDPTSLKLAQANLLSELADELKKLMKKFG
ncbi:DUF262 domain-containing protein [Ovoidimarina sediminis]|uniref:DUF262 domain-containing protein n=1 Tax=Ovoidimarina sediminis TaxID=3079856 RepID=UPI00290C5E63|nr:DUF262 domain-containing protein [Rhodophyticola sp. MJ-SS7]MDU8943536.1 DUF262 domain-containing protein [Rhodophyticola sp. MJ-SS7]